MKKIIILLLASAISIASFAQQPLDTLKMDDLRKSTVLTIDEVIAGRIPGVNVSFSDDAPGRLADYNFRGLDSANPLFVVDGARVDHAFVQAINPAQVETIVVLTDIAATSRYGSEGCAGVVEITMKKGQYGKIKVEADAAVGANLLSSASLEGTDYAGGAASSALLQDYSVSVSGGSETAGNKFFVNLGYMGDGGVLKGTSFARFQGSLRYEQELSKSVDFYIGAAYRSTTHNGIETSVPYADYMVKNDVPSPYYGLDSYIMYYVMGQGADPVATLDNAYAKSINSYVTGNVGLNWEIVKGLNFGLRGYYNALNADNQSFNNKRTIFGAPDSPFGMNINAKALANNINRYEGEAFLSYCNTFASGSLLNAKAAFLVHGANNSYRGERTYNMTTEALGTAALNTGTYIPVPNFNSNYNYLQAYANFLYSIKGRYDIFASLSADNFNGTENKQWKILPSVGAAWNFAKESSVAGGALSSGRLTASWGQVGYSYPMEYPDGVIIFRQYANQIDASLSAGFWKDRLSAKVGYYNISTDLLKLNGLEASLNAYPVRNDIIKWSVFANATFGFGESKTNWGGAGTVLEVAGFDFRTNIYWNPDYFRCANVTAGYTFGRQLLKVCSLRLFVNARNLCHKSIYSGFDFNENPATMAPGRYSVTGGLSLSF